MVTATGKGVPWELSGNYVRKLPFTVEEDPLGNCTCSLQPLHVECFCCFKNFSFNNHQCNGVRSSGVGGWIPSFFHELMCQAAAEADAAAKRKIKAACLNTSFRDTNPSIQKLSYCGNSSYYTSLIIPSEQIQETNIDP